jgi:hypothetical protein
MEKSVCSLVSSIHVYLKGKLHALISFYLNVQYLQAHHHTVPYQTVHSRHIIFLTLSKQN